MRTSDSSKTNVNGNAIMFLLPQQLLQYIIYKAAKLARTVNNKINRFLWKIPVLFPSLPTDADF